MMNAESFLPNLDRKIFLPIADKITKVLRFFGRLIKNIFIVAFRTLILIVIGISLAGFLTYRYDTPDARQLATGKIAQTSIIYDSSGKHILYELHGEEDRKMLSHEQIPDVIRLATLAAEDKNFYKHNGVDLIATARAFGVDVKNREASQGGSTITQQLVRNVFLNREKTLERKYREAIIAIKVEQNFSKEEILDNYLNRVPYGSNTYGIQSAAEKYFAKDAKKLTLDEAAYLAALPKAPAYYSPYGRHKDELEARKKNIIARMKDLGYISLSDAEVAGEANTFAKVQPFREPIQAPQFVFFVIEQLEEKYGREYLETGGLRITTTLDYEMQKNAEQIVAKGAERNATFGSDNAGLVAVDPKSGAILAMVGSKDFFSETSDGQVNVTTSLRQPGSSFKPIVYAAAFERGYEPESLIEDKPTNFGSDGSGLDYIPRNYDGRFHGTLPMRSALAMSLNIPAVKTLSMIGVDAGKEMARRLGITSIAANQAAGLSTAIGAAEVRPLDMAAAFSVFANDGIKNKPYAVFEIKQPDGSIETEKSHPVRILDPQVARKINSILTDNKARTPTFGPNSPLAFPAGQQVAAKTGTSQDFRDAWTVGFTPSISVAVWCGNNDGHPMKAGSDGVFVAAPIWRAFMDQNLSRFPSEGFASYQVNEKVKLASAERLKAMRERKDKDEDDDDDKKKKKKG